ncbi:MAG: hypothetical protein GKR96_10485 [Gammaproteobacteria bacterium]|nr:hypothetical protein [Gammaproteobacteria bacterium]
MKELEKWCLTIQISIQSLSKRVGASESKAIRFCRSFGASGFRNLN